VVSVRVVVLVARVAVLVARVAILVARVVVRPVGRDATEDGECRANELLFRLRRPISSHARPAPVDT
jgi:hypothetical protein